MNHTKQKLALAQQKAKELFTIVEERGLIVAGKMESGLSKEVVQLAKDIFGIENYWHKKIIRAGVNTLQPFSGNPPDREIQNDDIVVLDFGPIFEGYEADLGRTYVIGNDPLKLKIKKDVETAWYEAKDWYDKQRNLTGAAFFNYVIDLTKRYGYEFGNEIAGHLVGPFPHEQPDDPNDLCFDIHPGNHSSILLLDKQGNSRNWILEIQFVDRKNNIGAFFEQLLN
jgi:Xaa-Pro aminopeptidase